MNSRKMKLNSRTCFVNGQKRMELSLGDHMEIKKQIEELYKALNNSERTDKAELKREIGCCINSLIVYFNAVVSEQLYYSSTDDKERKVYEMKLRDEQRSEKHDDCIRACARLNEICRLVNVSEIFDFDIKDRRKVAATCGLIAGELFFSNLNNEGALKDCLTFADRNIHDLDVFANVFAKNLTEELSWRYDDKKFEPLCWDDKDNNLIVEYSDPNGKRERISEEIDLSRLYEPGYINKQVNLFMWDIASIYEADENGEEPPARSPKNSHANTLSRFERITELFVSEFKGWCDEKVANYEGDYDWAIHDICELMSNAFYTDDRKIADLISPFDIEKIETVLNSWGDYYQFRYAEDVKDKYIGDLTLKNWILTRDGESSKLRISLMKKGYFYIRLVEKQKNGFYQDGTTMYSYNYESLDHWIWSWSSGRF